MRLRISKREDEILKLNQRIISHKPDGCGIDALKYRLGLLRHENLESAGFDEKLQMMRLLDIKVYPSEDLKTVRIRTGLGIGIGEANENRQDNCGKVLFAPPKETIPRTGRFRKVSFLRPGSFQ